MKRTTIILLTAILSGSTALAQESVWRDTLQAAVKTDTRRVEQRSYE